MSIRVKASINITINLFCFNATISLIVVLIKGCDNIIEYKIRYKISE
jgi:hypothetical protein